MNSARTRTLNATVCFSGERAVILNVSARNGGRGGGGALGALRTMLLAIEVLDAVACLFVLAELVLVLLGVELGRLCPGCGDLTLELVHCGER